MRAATLLLFATAALAGPIGLRPFYSNSTTPCSASKTAHAQLTEPSPDPVPDSWAADFTPSIEFASHLASSTARTASLTQTAMGAVFTHAPDEVKVRAVPTASNKCPSATGAFTHPSYAPSGWPHSHGFPPGFPPGFPHGFPHSGMPPFAKPTKASTIGPLTTTTPESTA